jgi:hypothetical protein
MRRWLICILLVLAACGGDDDDDKKASKDTKPEDKKTVVVATDSLAEFCEDFAKAQPVYEGFQPTSKEAFDELRDAVRSMRYPKDLAGQALILDRGISLVIDGLRPLDFKTQGKAKIDELIKTKQIQDSIVAYYVIDVRAPGLCKSKG